MEELTCESCSTVWKRPKTRGRKPRFCAECLSEGVNINPPQKEEKKTDFSISFPPPSKWICPTCSISISIYVGVDIAPTHVCAKKLSQVIPLEKV